MSYYKIEEAIFPDEGVYIKGIKKPKNCKKCQLEYLGSCMAMKSDRKGRVHRYITDEEFSSNKRPKWCPIREERREENNETD